MMDSSPQRGKERNCLIKPSKHPFNKAHYNAIRMLLGMLVIMGYATGVHAGGLEFPGIGTQAAGRGGAYVAKATGGSAFLYNPAGLAKSTGKDLLVSFQLVNLRLDYQRTGSGGYWLDTPGDNLSPTCPPQQICIADPALDYSDSALGQPFSEVSMSKSGPLPVLVFNWGNFVNVKGLSVSVGLVPPSGFAAFSLPESGAQRYTLVNSAHFIIFPGIGLAYKFNRYFQLGGVFMSGIAHLNQTLKIRPLPSMANSAFNEGAGGDANLEISALDPFVPTAVIGVMSLPTDWLELGVSVKLPAMISAKGSMVYDAPSNDMTDSYMEKGKDQTRLEQHFPLKVSAGVRFIANRFDIEADFVFENWASLSGFDIFPDAAITDPIDANVVVDTPMPDTQIIKNYRNTYCGRLGSTIAVLPRFLDIHLGSFYQSSAYPKNNNTFNLDVPYATQIGVAGGISVAIGDRLDIHLSYLHIFQPDISVSNGVIQQQGLPLSTGENIGNTVNNGTYEVAINILGIAGEVHF